jgi:hypothetical protein
LNHDEIDRLDRDTAILLQPYGAPHYLHTIDYWDLTTAYAHLKDSHPELYWNPPLTYDDNPYVKNSGKLPDQPPPPPPGNWMPTIKKEASVPPEPPSFGTPVTLDDIFRFSKQKPGTPEEYERQRKWLDEAHRAKYPKGINWQVVFPEDKEPPKPPIPPKSPPSPSKPKGFNWEGVFPDEDEPPKPPSAVNPAGGLGEVVFGEDDEMHPPDDPLKNKQDR